MRSRKTLEPISKPPKTKSNGGPRCTADSASSSRFSNQVLQFREVLKQPLILCLCLALLMAISFGSASAQTGTLPLPPRPSGAMTGSEFYTYVLNMTDSEREQAIIDEIATGNVPDFIRDLVPVTVTETVGGSSHTITYFVTPDYMAIGSDSDFFRMPMSAPLAQQVVDLMDCHLTTRKMTDDIWAASTIKLSPFFYSPNSYDIDSIEVIWLHNETVDGQMSGQTLGSLVAGHKKDVVITPQITTRPPPPRVAIYGWHYTSGTPIQPLSLVHGAYYEDYSHGIRAVEDLVVLDGQSTTIQAILADSNLAGLLSDEGAFTDEYPVPNPYPLPDDPQNLVTGGGFEDGFTGGAGNGWSSWTASGSAAITFGQASFNKYEGDHSQYWSRGDTLTIDGGVYQTISTVSGQTYDFSAWMKRQSTFTGTVMEFGYDLTGGTDGTAGSVTYVDLTSAPDNTWTKASGSFTATGSSVTFFARGGHTSTSGGSNAYFYLDAVKLYGVDSEIIVDNDDGSPAYTETGAWSTSGSSGYDGGSYKFATVGGSHSATWDPDLSSAGTYEIEVMYRAGANRASSARYDIDTSTGTSTVYVNQTLNDLTWVSLGTFDLDSNSDVTLDASGSTGNSVVIADAVRFTSTGSAPDTTPPAAPTGLSATGDDGFVSLDWNDSSEPDFSGYAVYRSTTSSSGYSLLDEDLTNSSFIDLTVTNGTTYYYVVTAEDTSANESGNSTEDSATPEAPATIPYGSLDLDNFTIGSYTGQDIDSSSWQLQDSGHTINMYGNTWKVIPLNYNVTANTVVEFDFKSDGTEPEIGGIGFDNDTTLSSDQTWKVYGTQAWGYTTYDNYSPSGWTSYSIPVGQSLTAGTYTYLVLVNDFDGGSGSNSYIRNIRVYESQSIVDNDDGSPDYTTTGSWTTSGSSGYDGSTYQFAFTGQSSTATWDLDIPVAGTYKVEVIYRASTNRADNVKYTITTASGTQTVYKDQTTGNLVWDELGTWSFDGGDGVVTLDASGSSGGDVVISDAVRVTLVP